MDKITVKYEIAFDVLADSPALGLRDADRKVRDILPAGSYAKRLGYYEGPDNTFHREDRDALGL